MSAQREIDQTPPSIDVWVCPQCGYWREDESSGVHMDYRRTTRHGERHSLVKARYIFLAEVEAS